MTDIIRVTCDGVVVMDTEFTRESFIEMLLTVSARTPPQGDETCDVFMGELASRSAALFVDVVTALV